MPKEEFVDCVLCDEDDVQIRPSYSTLVLLEPELEFDIAENS